MHIQVALSEKRDCDDKNEIIWLVNYQYKMEIYEILGAHLKPRRLFFHISSASAIYSNENTQQSWAEKRISDEFNNMQAYN